MHFLSSLFQNALPETFSTALMSPHRKSCWKVSSSNGDLRGLLIHLHSVLQSLSCPLIDPIAPPRCTRRQGVAALTRRPKVAAEEVPSTTLELFTTERQEAATHGRFSARIGHAVPTVPTPVLFERTTHVFLRSFLFQSCGLKASIICILVHPLKDSRSKEHDNVMVNMLMSIQECVINHADMDEFLGLPQCMASSCQPWVHFDDCHEGSSNVGEIGVASSASCQLGNQTSGAFFSNASTQSAVAQSL